MILKKTTVENCGVWGAEGKRVRTFTNDRHAKKNRRSSDEEKINQTSSNSHTLKKSR